MDIQHRIIELQISLNHIFEEAQGRLFVTVFNQNIYRVIEIIELANKYNRKIMIFSDELKTMMSEMAELGYYRIPAGLEIARDSFNNDREDVLVIIGGNGSTIFNKVHKIATKEDDLIEFRSTDTVIIASPAVPGTERSEASMEDDLYREAGNVVAIDAKRAFTMHASIEDLKMMLYLLKPRYYIPVKGEYRQLIANANIALDMGYNAERIVVMDNGEVADFEDGKLKKSFDHVQAGDVMVDGSESLDATGMVLKDRETLSTDGAMIIGVVINHATKEIIGGPDVQSRGVIYLKDADYIVKQVGEIMEKTINDAVKSKHYSNLDCRADARDKIARYILHETGKRPMILPAIVEINTAE
jgi:ribonuclease J